MNFARAGVILFTLAVVTGPLYSVDGYSHIRHLVSHLGAQNTPNSFIMIAGFLCLGGGMIVEGARHFTVRALPFMAFGGFMALAGLFPHMPIDSTLPYDESFHVLHGLFATIAGISITIGFVWMALVSGTRVKCLVSALLAAVCLIFPLAMLAFPEVQGLIQRLMYVAIFTWIWVNIPTEWRYLKGYSTSLET